MRDRNEKNGHNDKNFDYEKQIEDSRREGILISLIY